jgi:hypothetical protein
LLRFIPLPNLPGSSQNYHVSATTDSMADNINLRLTQNLSRTVVGRGGRGGAAGGRGGAGFGGRGGPGGGPAGRGVGRGTNVMLNVRLQYRRNENQTPNVFLALAGQNTSTAFSVLISLNVRGPVAAEHHGECHACVLTLHEPVYRC